MQVNCPNCGEKVTADNINIQKMTAVCGACDTVFLVELPVPKTKIKRRKVKQPSNLTLRDAETLHMAFRTNFRLDQNEAFITSAILGSIPGFVGILMLVVGEGKIPTVIPTAFLTVALVLWYFVALTVVNKTHIEMSDDSITITRKPLPNPFSQVNEVLLDGVEAIRYEETEVSKKEGYDTQRYRVWAQTADGSRRTIVNDVTEAYAVFIAQRLDERLQADGDLDDARLSESSHLLDEDVDVEDGGLTELLIESRRQSSV
jgi:hypothetical protein